MAIEDSRELGDIRKNLMLDIKRETLATDETLSKGDLVEYSSGDVAQADGDSERTFGVALASVDESEDDTVRVARSGVVFVKKEDDTAMDNGEIAVPASSGAVTSRDSETGEQFVGEVYASAASDDDGVLVKL